MSFNTYFDFAEALLSKVDFVSRYAFSTITKRTYQTSGGTRQAEKDFESLKPRNVASNSVSAIH